MFQFKRPQKKHLYYSCECRPEPASYSQFASLSIWLSSYQKKNVYQKFCFSTSSRLPHNYHDSAITNVTTLNQNKAPFYRPGNARSFMNRKASYSRDALVLITTFNCGAIPYGSRNASIDYGAGVLVKSICQIVFKTVRLIHWF